MSSIVTFTFKQIFAIKIMPSLLNGIKVPRLLDTASKFALFSVSGLKELIKCKPA